MSYYGTHPLPLRTKQAALLALPKRCRRCRYYWRCGREVWWCWSCGPYPSRYRFEQIAQHETP